MHEVTGRAWPAIVSGALMTVSQGLSPWRWFHPGGSDPFTHGSPSQFFGVVFLLVASVLLVRGRPIGAGGWVVLALAVAASPGSKPAVLPVLMAAIAACLLANLVRRGAVRGPFLALALMAASVLAFSGLAQTSTGSKLKLFGLLLFYQPWSHTAPGLEGPGTGGSVLLGLADPGLVALAVLVSVAILLQGGSALAGLVLLGDSRAFWVAGLTERRMLVESWGYTEEAFQRIGSARKSFSLFPFDDQDRLVVNDYVFRSPTPAGLALLRDRYGVRWLFAVRRAGPVSSLLAQHADLRFRTADVDVYQLRAR